MVVIPILGLQTDPEYYPNPDLYDPDRYSDTNKSNKIAFTWMPFGEGPRICIGTNIGSYNKKKTKIYVSVCMFVGMRFGLMQTKIGLVTLLNKNRVTLSSKTKIPLKLDAKTFITTTESPIYLNIERVFRHNLKG